MTTTQTQTDTMTLADVFERLGLRPDQIADMEHYSLDRAVERYHWCLDDNGCSFVSCGGEALVAIYWAPQGNQYIRTTRPAYISRDDTAERHWDFVRMTEHDGDGYATVQALGSKPSPIYRIAQSG